MISSLICAESGLSWLPVKMSLDMITHQFEMESSSLIRKGLWCWLCVRDQTFFVGFCLVTCRWGRRTRNRKTSKVTQKQLKNHFSGTKAKWLKDDSNFDSFPEKSHFRNLLSVAFPGPWVVNFESSKMPNGVSQFLPSLPNILGLRNKEQSLLFFGGGSLFLPTYQRSKGQGAWWVVLPSEWITEMPRKVRPKFRPILRTIFCPVIKVCRHNFALGNVRRNVSVSKKHLEQPHLGTAEGSRISHLGRRVSFRYSSDMLGLEGPSQC